MVFTVVGTANLTTAQAVKKGNIIIDPYYGFPNFGNTLAGVVSDIINMNSSSSVTSEPKLFGPAGLRAEYMVADNFGLGIDFIYNNAGVEGTIDSLNNNDEVVKTYDISGTAHRFRFQVRANYHFIQDETFDAYVGFGAGTNLRSIRFNTDFPDFDLNNATGVIVPFSLRLALGSRYYFSENVGLNLELGLGGPVVSVGLSVKI